MAADAKDSPGQGSTLAQMGREVLSALIPLVVSAGGLTVLVFGVGAAVSVARYEAAGLPWEQAITAASESDVRTIGLIWLTMFGVLGLFAVALAYIASPQGRATAAMYYAVIAVATAEAGVVWYGAKEGAEWHVEGKDWAAGAVLLLAAAAAVIIVAILHIRARRKAARQKLAAERKEWAKAPWKKPDEPREVNPGTPPRELARRAAAPILIAVLASIVAAIVFEPPWFALAGLAVLIAGAGVIVFFEWLKVARDLDLSPETMMQEEKAREELDPALALPLWAFLILGVLSVGAGVWTALLLGNFWVAPSVIFAGLLGMLTIRVAELGTGFRWYGVSVFFAVGLFGAVVGVLRMLDEPRLQPVAFLLKEGDVVKGVEGVYIGESDDRLWFASVALESCNDDTVRRGSGRLRSVPTDAVSSVSIGPQMGLPKLAFEARAMLDAVMLEHPGDEPLAGPVAVRDAVELDTLGDQRRESGRWVTLADDEGADEGLGGHPRLTLNGRRLRLKRPRGEDDSWQVRLPRGAASGPVYADCAERTNGAFLTVNERPQLIVTATSQGRQEWRLSARGSFDADGQIRWYRWKAGSDWLGWGRTRDVRVADESQREVTLVVRDDDRLRAVSSLRLTGDLVRVYPADLLFCFECRRLSERGARLIRALRDEVAGARLVKIHAHTDERRGKAQNDALSAAQAKAVEHVLLGDRFPAENRDVRGYGERRPLARGAHRRNRRVVVVIRYRRQAS